MKNLTKRLRYSLYLLLVTCVFSGISAQEPDIFIRVRFSDGNFVLMPEAEFNVLAENNLIKINSQYNCPEIKTKENQDVVFINKELNFMELFIEYNTECYNDSVLTGIPYSCGVVGCLVNHYPIKKYIHKQPTLSDFIAWVRKKYGY